MTSQQQADRLLLVWQGNRHLPADRRLPESGDPFVIAQMDRQLAAVARDVGRAQ